MKKIRRSYKRRNRTRQKNVPANKFARIILFSLIIVIIASFYIYQRVWVRKLDSENKELKKRNLLAEQYLNDLRKEWVEISTMKNVEELVAEFKLDLRPTSPAQNFVIYPDQIVEDKEYAGLERALKKLKDGLPKIAPSEAEAKQLIDKE
jgi:hypothetical protein